MKTLIIIATALSLSGLATHAATAQDVKASRAVATQDLNLSTENGVKTLKLRIHHAASQLCGGAASSEYVQERRAFKACYKAATESTIVAVQAKMTVSLAAR